MHCIARETKFMKRKGKVLPSYFINTLLFNENDQAHASLPDLSTGCNQDYGIDIIKNAMHKKLTLGAVKFLIGLLGKLLAGKQWAYAEKGLLLYLQDSKEKTRVFPPATFKCNRFFSYHKKACALVYKYFCKQLHN
jgi:hypothetical protein